jgi:hypothetical protein
MKKRYAIKFGLLVTALKNLRIPLLIAFGLPCFQVAAMAASSVYLSENRLNIALIAMVGPVMSQALAYLYFPYATAEKKFFNSHNTAKSIVLALVAFETIRQTFIAIKMAAGVSFGALIQSNCTSAVDTFADAAKCATAVWLQLASYNVVWWLLPALLLEFISSRVARKRRLLGDA